MIQRRAAAAVAAAAVVLSVSACGIESPAETQREHSPVQAADFAVGAVQVRNAFLTYPTTEPTTAYIVVTFVNDGSQPDTLTGVTSPAGSVQFGGTANSSAGLTLPPGVVVQAVDPSLGTPGTTLVLQPVGTPPAVGTSVPATFTFASGGASRTVHLPVVPPGRTTHLIQVIPSSPAVTPTESDIPPAVD